MHTTATPQAIAQPSATGHRPLAGFGNVLRSEFWKLRSVRSTVWTLLAAVVANIVLAALAAIFLPGQLSRQERATVDSIRLSLAGLHLSQIAIGVLGVLVITSEYSTGTIRATLTAVPRRRMMLAAKTLVFAATALVVGILSCYGAYVVFNVFVSDASMKSSIGDPGVLRAVTGGGLYLALLGLLGLGLGTILRTGAGAIATLLGLLFVPSILVNLLPHAWQTTIGPYLPMNAGEQMYALRVEADGLGALAGFGVLSLYAALTLTIGFALINHRDA